MRRWLEQFLEKFACRRDEDDSVIPDDGQGTVEISIKLSKIFHNFFFDFLRICLLFLVRIVVIGDGASGKTALLTRLISNEFDLSGAYVPTIFENKAHQMTIDNQQVISFL